MKTEILTAITKHDESLALCHQKTTQLKWQVPQVGKQSNRAYDAGFDGMMMGLFSPGEQPQ